MDWTDREQQEYENLLLGEAIRAEVEKDDDTIDNLMAAYIYVERDNRALREAIRCLKFQRVTACCLVAGGLMWWGIARLWRMW